MDYTFNFLFNKVTDEKKFCRKVTRKIPGVVDRETTPLEDAMLNFPGVNDYTTQQILLETPTNNPTEEELLQAIMAETGIKKVKIAKEHAEKAEKELKEKNKKEQLQAEVQRVQPLIDQCVQIYNKTKDYEVFKNKLNLIGIISDWRGNPENISIQISYDVFSLLKVESVKTIFCNVKAETEEKAKEEKEKEKEKNKAARVKEKLEWIAANGSDRLKEQIAQNYNGFQLYLKERLNYELGEDAEIVKVDEETPDMDKNPAMEHLVECRKIAELSVKMGWFANMDKAFIGVFVGHSVTTDYDGYEEVENVNKWIIVDGWRPGKEKSWDTYTVKIPV